MSSAKIDTLDPAPTALDKIRDHYRATGLTERLRTALLAFGPEDRRLSPERLAQLDQFHTRGLAATADLARMARITRSDRVLDVGSGVGGPARVLAATCGCEVVGVDLSEPFTEAARYLTERTGQAEKVRFETGNALELPFEKDGFDAVFLQHVAMNIADRAGLYAEIRRVLKPGGRFATFDIIWAAGEPHYPVPWARTPETSFLLTEGETRDAVEAAGFRTRAWHDDSDTAKAWFAQAMAAGPPPAPNLGIVMGPEFPSLAGNLARSVMEGRVRVLAAVFDKP
jgi:sarcosine/dimethylglycine N-methyltransferase